MVIRRGTKVVGMVVAVPYRVARLPFPISFPLVLDGACISIDSASGNLSSLTFAYLPFRFSNPLNLIQHASSMSMARARLGTTVNFFGIRPIT